MWFWSQSNDLVSADATLNCAAGTQKIKVYGGAEVEAPADNKAPAEPTMQPPACQNIDALLAVRCCADMAGAQDRCRPDTSVTAVAEAGSSPGPTECQLCVSARGHFQCLSLMCPTISASSLTHGLPATTSGSGQIFESVSCQPAEQSGSL